MITRAGAAFFNDASERAYDELKQQGKEMWEDGSSPEDHRIMCSLYFMTIPEMRTFINRTQEEFAMEYEIPLETLQRWESGKEACPEYVRKLLAKLISKEFNIPL